MSPHETFIAGRLPCPQPRSSGLYLQPPAETQASHSAKVASNFPTANGLAIVTLCTGFSLLYSSEPIMNSPAGTTTISGHVSQSLKLSLGFRQRFSLPTCATTPSHHAGARPGGAVIAGFAWGVGSRAFG